MSVMSSRVTPYPLHIINPLKPNGNYMYQLL
jgi:hypothetical protein